LRDGAAPAIREFRATALLNSLATIGPLAKNGGSTLTGALLPGSSAIDDGDPAFGCAGPNGLPLPTDQRGVDRVHGMGCDVGAYGFRVIFLDGFESGEP
jgi:hypothetical protein